MSRYPAKINLFKVNNRNTRKKYEICSKVTMKTQERRHWRLPNISCAFHLRPATRGKVLVSFFIWQVSSSIVTIAKHIFSYKVILGLQSVSHFRQHIKDIIDKIMYALSYFFLMKSHVTDVLSKSTKINKCLGPATLLKKRLWHRCFPVNFCEISKNRTYFFTEHLLGGCFCLSSS